VENGVTAEYFYFYGLDGKREATYKVTSNAPTGLNNYNASLVGTAQDVLVYFGGETIQEGSYGSTLSLSYATADRLGSMPGGAKLDPYGQEISATANDKVKFATYLRDGESGIDYAMNRYYAAGRGRFLTADPSRERRARRSGELESIWVRQQRPNQRLRPTRLVHGHCNRRRR
jgi:RHS repeat-associated protein